MYLDAVVACVHWVTTQEEERCSGYWWSLETIVHFVPDNLAFPRWDTYTVIIVKEKTVTVVDEGHSEMHTQGMQLCPYQLYNSVSKSDTCHSVGR